MKWEFCYFNATYEKNYKNQMSFIVSWHFRFCIPTYFRTINQVDVGWNLVSMSIKSFIVSLIENEIVL